MLTLIVKYKVGRDDTGAYPVDTWAKRSKFTPKDPEARARDEHHYDIA